MLAISLAQSIGKVDLIHGRASGIQQLIIKGRALEKVWCIAANACVIAAMMKGWQLVLPYHAYHAASPVAWLLCLMRCFPANFDPFLGKDPSTHQMGIIRLNDIIE